jgi:protein-tyrosine phosphatase
MVDLHHHLLPGLDDGSPDLQTSIAMARMAADDGITHVVCTPHANHRYPFDPKIIAQRLAELRQALADAGITLILGSGCDFHISYDNVQDAILSPRKYTVNGGEYLMIELPDFAVPLNLSETLYQLRVAGMTPILTHPERNPTLQRDEDRLAEWVRSGLLLQVTANSVTGQMGKLAEKMAHKLLANRWVHFISTDAHNLLSRPPEMGPAYDLISRRYGSEYADLLCTTNPLSVFDNRHLPQQEEPLNLYDDLGGHSGTRWWQRLFAR